MRLALAAATAVFIALGILLIPYSGIQMDEALFALPFYQPPDPGFSIPIFGLQVPLMVFPYIGTLKTILYWPVFAVFDPGTYSIRVPALLIAAAAIPLLFLWTRRITGSIAAALIATLLFATDPSYLISTAIDRGPVALQVLLTVLGCLLFAQRRPALACFLFGLALWNKVIFAWMLSGLAFAAVIVYTAEVRAILADRRAVFRCVIAFLLGVAPLIAFNLHSANRTFAVTHVGIENLEARWITLETTLDGSNLFGYISAPESLGNAKPPASLPGKIAAALRDILGNHYKSLLLYAAILSLLAAPLWWKQSLGSAASPPMRRAGLFAILAFAAAFFAMTITRYTGFSHHVVLLWPLPHLLVGVAVASLPLRWLRVSLAALLIASNLLVVNQWITDFETFGTYTDYTDALNPLSRALGEYASSPIYMADSGATWNTHVLQKGRLDLIDAWSTLNIPSDPTDPGTEQDVEQRVTEWITNPSGIFVGRVPERTAQAPARERLTRIAQAAGYEERIVGVIPDSNGRAVFQLFRLERTDPEGSTGNAELE